MSFLLFFFPSNTHLQKPWNNCFKHLLIIWLVTFDSFDILCSDQISTFETCKILGTNFERYCGVCPMKVSCTDLLLLHIYLGRYCFFLVLSATSTNTLVLIVLSLMVLKFGTLYLLLSRQLKTLKLLKQLIKKWNGASCNCMVCSQ